MKSARIFSGLLVICLVIGRFIDTAEAEEVARLYSAEGSVESALAGGNDWKSVSSGQAFAELDAVRTGERSRAGVRFSDGYLVRMNEKTTIRFKDIQTKDNARPVQLQQGSGYFFSRKPRNFPQVVTPQVSASVRGTEFVVAVVGDETVISVLSGVVLAENQHGSASVGKGEQVVTRANQAPEKRILVNPIDAVQWAIYFPHLTVEGRGILADAAKALAAGQVEQAELALQNAERSVSTAREKALLNAMRAVIALAKNDKEKARTLADQAVGSDGSSTTAALVRSYVAQAQFDLHAARNWLERAISLDSNNALAYARLAEIYLGFGDTDKANEMAEQALTLDPGNAYALTVRGFSELSRYNSEAARSSFERAIAKDSGFALAHLGRGLSFVRDGELAMGRTELEQAVMLDPTVSLYRSYLGKAYYEIEDEGMTRDELARAMELDPNDPTPYLYRSILNLTAHRPVEAFRDIEKSIEKNDNRAVYRSQLMLDQDQATRSSSLGQIYSRVGFTELARLEATKSLQYDYSNYSAHFLLADVFNEVHLNDRASTTEQLLGRLLAPVNYNANKINIGGAASLNEYTTLFDRPMSRTNIDGLANSQDETYAGQVEHAAASNRFGYNIGYSYFQRDGYRDNDTIKDHQIFTLGQYQANDKGLLVWDGALTFNETGDVQQRFDPYQEDADLETDIDNYLARVGYQHKVAPGLTILSQAFYQYTDQDESDGGNTSRLSFLEATNSGVPVGDTAAFFPGRTDHDNTVHRNLVGGDLQAIWNTEEFSTVVGVSGNYDKADSDEDAIVSSVGGVNALRPILGFPLMSDATVDQTTNRAFLYSTWHGIDWLDITGGIVYSHVELSENAFSPPFVDETYTKDDFDPKVGFMLETPWGSTIRGTYLRSLDGAGRGGLGPLEPTYVGGFNQVFDGVRGSEQELFGIGIDHRFPTETFVGVNYQHRDIDLNVPYLEGGLTIDRDTSVVSETTRSSTNSGSADEDRVFVYVYQLIGDRVSATVDYTYENFDEDSPLPEIETYRVAPRLNYFDPSGFFAFAESTFRSQEIGGDVNAKTDENFWVLDAGLGYELDWRRGAVTLSFENILDQDFEYSTIRDEFAVRPEFGARLDLSFNF